MAEEIVEQTQAIEQAEEPIVLPSDENKEQAVGEVTTQPKEEVKEEESQDEILEEVEKSTGLDMTAFEKEYAESGKLSEKSYKALEKAGIPRITVDRYIEGRVAYSNQYDNALYSIVGGENEFKSMVDWASKNLSEKEKLAYNNAVNSYNLELAKMATEGLFVRYKQNTPSDKNISLEGQKGSDTGSYYTSMTELVADQRDKRYETDPRFRKAVEEKIQRSLNGGYL